MILSLHASALDSLHNLNLSTNYGSKPSSMPLTSELIPQCCGLCKVTIAEPFLPNAVLLQDDIQLPDGRLEVGARNSSSYKPKAVNPPIYSTNNTQE